MPNIIHHLKTKFTETLTSNLKVNILRLLKESTAVEFMFNDTL